MAEQREAEREGSGADAGAVVGEARSSLRDAVRRHFEAQRAVNAAFEEEYAADALYRDAAPKYDKEGRAIMLCPRCAAEFVSGPTVAETDPLSDDIKLTLEGIDLMIEDCRRLSREP